MYAFLIPLLLGFALVWASAFTGAHSRRWGERGGQLATNMLRNLLGIPLVAIGFVLAALTPAPLLFSPSTATGILGWLFIALGSFPLVWGHLLLGWRTHIPSVRDTLVSQGLYGYVRHPIYTGAILILVGAVLIRPTFTGALASGLAMGGLVVQARLEELDLLQRLPAYREYMGRVPRFMPRLRRRA